MITRPHSLAALSLLSLTAMACAADNDATTAPKLSLEPQSTAPSDGLLMQGLDKLGAQKPLHDLHLKVYGWVQTGYTFSLRHHGGEGSSLLGGYYGVGPFNREAGNHLQLNQVVLRVEREVDSSKFDIGGMVELLEGTDANYLKTNGIQFQTTGDNPGEVPQFELPQAYLDINLPLGNGLKVRIGKFANLAGYESVDPRSNAFYSHSLLFSAINYSPETGVVGFYKINDQWKVAGGIDRGTAESVTDSNDAIRGIAQVIFSPNKQWTFALTTTAGPDLAYDNDDYGLMLNPVVTWQATERLKFAAEGVYTRQGYPGFVHDWLGAPHDYTEDYGLAAYASYTINDYLTANLRTEWAYDDELGWNTHYYEFTAGVTIHPLPKDPVGKNLLIRPELRYIYSEYPDYPTGNPATSYNDQWTLAADIIFTF